MLPADDVDLIDEYRSAFDRKWPVSNYFDIGHTFGLDEVRGLRDESLREISVVVRTGATGHRKSLGTFSNVVSA